MAAPEFHTRSVLMLADLASISITRFAQFFAPGVPGCADFACDAIFRASTQSPSSFTTRARFHDAIAASGRSPHLAMKFFRATLKYAFLSSPLAVFQPQTNRSRSASQKADRSWSAL